MITLKIMAPKPSFGDRVRETFGVPREHTPTVLHSPMRHQHQPHINHRHLPTHRWTEADRWPKLTYDKYICKVQEKFHLDQYVTLAHMRPNAHLEPKFEFVRPVAYRLKFINELWYDVEYDHDIMEPKCLVLSGVSFNTGRMWATTPTRLRPMTVEEIEIVLRRDAAVQQAKDDADIRNQAVQSTT